MTLKILRKLLTASCVVFFVVFIVNAFKTTGDDFRVFWEAGRHYLQGEPLYSTLRDGVKCYKYPPWSTVLFVPISLIPFRTACVVWRFFLLGTLIYNTLWLQRRTKFSESAWLALLLFWGVWMYNWNTGQITSLLLALSLWGFDRIHQSAIAGWTAISASLSTKLFNSVAIVGLPRSAFKLKPILWTTLILGLLSLPALVAYHGSPRLMIQAYLDTAGEHGAYMGGSHNGISCLLLDLFHLEHHFTPHLLSWGASVVLLVTVFNFFCRRIQDPATRFVCALALGMTTTPVLYTYSLGWALPLVGLSLDRVFTNHSNYRVPRLLTIAGVLWLLAPLPARALGPWLMALGIARMSTKLKTHETET